MSKKIILIVLLTAGIILATALFFLSGESQNPKVKNMDAPRSAVEEQKPVENIKVETPGSNEIPVETTEPMLVGGDKDEHGCIGSAGYTWCESKEKCLRPWEEKCE